MDLRPPFMALVRVHAGLITMNLITVNPVQLQISHIRAMDETAMDSTTRGGRHNVVDAARKTLFTPDPFAMKVLQAMKDPPRPSNNHTFYMAAPDYHEA